MSETKREAHPGEGGLQAASGRSNGNGSTEKPYDPTKNFYHRMHHCLITSPEVMELNDAQKFVWEIVIMFACRSPKPGQILHTNGSPVKVDHVRRYAHPDTDVQGAIDHFIKIGWLERKRGVFLVVNHPKFFGPLDPFAAERQRKWREGQANKNGQ